MTRSVSEHLRPWGNWRRKRFWILVVLLLYTLLGFFALPRLVEKTLVETVEATGRSIDLGEVKSNPYALYLGISGLEIRDPDSTPIASFDEFFVNLQLSSLFRWAWTLDEIRLSGLHIEEERFAVGDTRWVRFIDNLTPPSETKEAEPENKSPPRVIIHRFILESGGLGITDQLAGGFKTRLGPVSVSASDLRTTPNHSGLKKVSIGTPSGGVIAWQGDLQIVPLASNGSFSIRGNGLPASLQYLDHFLPISIEGEQLEVDFDYSLTTGVDGLSIKATGIETKTGSIQVRMDDEDDPFVGVNQILLSGGTVEWPERSVVAESLTVDGLELTAWLEANGQLSLLDAIPSETDQADPSIPNDGSGMPEWRISINEFAVPNAVVNFEDRSLGTPASLVVNDLDLQLAGVDNQPQTPIKTSLAMQLENGGSISYQGDVVVLPGIEVQGRTTVSDLSLVTFEPWLQEIARIELESGAASVTLDVSGTPPGALNFSGSAEVTGLDIKDAVRNQRLAGFETLEIERFDIDQSAMTVKTSPVQLGGAFGRIHIFEDLTTNISGLMIESGEHQEEQAEEQPEQQGDGSGISITIAGVEMQNSSMDFADDSLPLPFRTLISNLNGNLSILSTDTAEPTRVQMEGQVDEFGQARISGALNPWDFTQSLDIEMIFRNLEMSTLTPYTVQYAGYAIETGRLDLDLGYVIQDRQLAGENSVVIRELVLGDKVEHPDAASLPLKLAVALLKDSDGVIDLDLPVSGDLDDPTFKISGVVWKAIGNLITRIVTSPFRFLGNLIGFDSEDFGTLRFQPGSSEVSPPDREQLNKLSEAMLKRPELALVVTGVYVAELDRAALKEIAFEAQLDATRELLLESGEADVLAFERPALETMFTAAFPATTLESIQTEFTSMDAEETPVLDEPAYLERLRSQLIQFQTVDVKALETLATARATAVAGLLQTNEDGRDRVTISTEIASGESEENSVLLELEVSVGDAVQETE